MKARSGKELSQIGIGSYGIGGRGHRDMEITEKDNDQVYIDALVYTLEQGINFTEIAVGYGHGESLRIFKQALDQSSVDRTDVFVTHSLYPRDLPTFDVLNQDIENFHQIMQTDYADSTLVTQSLILKFGQDDMYRKLHELLDSGKTCYVSLSNASPDWIVKFKQEFGDKFCAHEGHLSFEVRALQDKGVLDKCAELGVENIIWRPLRRNKTMQHNWPLLVELADKYDRTQSQIILNWICHHGCRPMVFSTNPIHVDENLAATSFEMSDADYGRMDSFRPPNYTPTAVDWEGPEIDNDIVRLVNEFESQLS